MDKINIMHYLDNSLLISLDADDVLGTDTNGQGNGQGMIKSKKYNEKIK